MQERARVDISMPFSPPPSSLGARVSYSWHFDTTLTSSTSLVCKSELEVTFGTTLTSSTFLACQSELERMFQHHSHLLHLPCMQEWAGGDISALLSPPPPLSCARELEMAFPFQPLSRILHLHHVCNSKPELMFRCRSHLPCMQEWAMRFMAFWCHLYLPVCTSSMSLVYKNEPAVDLYGISTSFLPL